jgi:hypothetical protein
MIRSKAARLRLDPFVVRKSAPADPASRCMEVSIVRRNVEPGGPPQTVSEPLWQ